MGWGCLIIAKKYFDVCNKQYSNLPPVSRFHSKISLPPPFSQLIYTLSPQLIVVWYAVGCLPEPAAMEGRKDREDATTNPPQIAATEKSVGKVQKDAANLLVCGHSKKFTRKKNEEFDLKFCNL